MVREFSAETIFKVRFTVRIVLVVVSLARQKIASSVGINDIRMVAFKIAFIRTDAALKSVIPIRLVLRRVAKKYLVTPTGIVEGLGI